MNKLKVTLITLLIVMLFGIAVYLGQTQTNILVVHSFDVDSPWVTQINHGIASYIEKNRGFASRVSVEYYYLDMELPIRQKCENYLTEMRSTEKILEDRKPDIVVVADDIAQRLVGVRLASYQPSGEKYFEENAAWLIQNGNCSKKQGISASLVSDMRPLLQDRRPKVIFLGIDNKAEEYGYQEAANVTGVFEHRYMASIKETFEDLYRSIPEESPKPQKVMIVADRALLTANEKERINTYLFSLPFDVPLAWGEVVEANSWDEWKEATRQANREQAMIFVAGYSNIRPIQPGKSVVKWMEACAQYPVLGGTTSFIADGGMIANTLSGQEQGEVVMSLAQQLLNSDISPADIQWKEPQRFTVSMNKALFVKRGLLDLPLIYTSFSSENSSYEDFDYQYEADCR